MTATGNKLLTGGLRELQRRLPPGWTVAESRRRLPAEVDAFARLSAPDGRSCELGLEGKLRLDPKGALFLVERTVGPRGRGPLVVVAPYLSAATRERLRESDIGYLDLTGNTHIVVSEPGLYVETQGASEDPDREARPARSLRGAKAGRIVRALLDRRATPGVRELASATGVDPGYVSRVLAFLDSEALVTRVGRGRMQGVDWPALLRRWAHDAPLDARGELGTYLEPRGLPALLTRLKSSDERYAVTGGLAAAALAPIAPLRLATVWLTDAAAAAARLGLRPAESGANVLLIDPNDEGVFEGATLRDGVRYAAPSQVAADLLTSPGRGPAESEELITWMQTHEEEWRQ